MFAIVRSQCDCFTLPQIAFTLVQQIRWMLDVLHHAIKSLLKKNLLKSIWNWFFLSANRHQATLPYTIYILLCTILLMPWYNYELIWNLPRKCNCHWCGWSTVHNRSNQKALFNRPFSPKMPTHLKLNLLMKWQQIIHTIFQCATSRAASHFSPRPRSRAILCRL